MADVVGAFIGREKVERNRDQAAYLLIVPRARGAQEGFQFGERELNGIEIGTVRWEEPQERTDLFDRGPDFRLLMQREVVEDDDIAWSQRRHQYLFDVGEETRIIDRPIEDGRGAETLEPERGDHGVGFPMAARRVIRESGAARASAIAS